MEGGFQGSLMSKQFSEFNVKRMKEGNAPFAPVGEKVGGRQTFEVHHKHEVAKGGEVYDMDNWSVMTPAQHIQHHRELKQ